MILPDSGAPEKGGLRHAPSAERNADSLLALLQEIMPARGRLLEIASGTGQHAAAFSSALPGLIWQPTDVDEANLATIAGWTTGTPALPPIVLDAARPGWAAAHPSDAVLLVNLLHLIATPACEVVLAEIAAALTPGGVALIYGPFLRDGLATSDGDRAFDASLRAQNPEVGYKDRDWAMGLLARHGLSVTIREMPANNLSLIARKPA